MFGFKQEHLDWILQRTVCHKRAAKNPFKEKKKKCWAVSQASHSFGSDASAQWSAQVSNGWNFYRPSPPKKRLKPQTSAASSQALWFVDADGGTGKSFFIEECFVLSFLRACCLLLFECSENTKRHEKKKKKNASQHSSTLKIIQFLFLFISYIWFRWTSGVGLF